MNSGFRLRFAVSMKKMYNKSLAQLKASTSGATIQGHLRPGTRPFANARTGGFADPSVRETAPRTTKNNKRERNDAMTGPASGDMNAVLKPLLLRLLHELEKQKKAKKAGSGAKKAQRGAPDSMKEVMLALSVTLMMNQFSEKEDKPAISEADSRAEIDGLYERIDEQSEQLIAWQGEIEQRLNHLTGIIESKMGENADVADLKRAFNLVSEDAIKALNALNEMGAAVNQQRDVIDNVKRVLNDRDSRMMAAERSNAHWQQRIEALERAVAQQQQQQIRQRVQEASEGFPIASAPASAPMRPRLAVDSTRPADQGPYVDPDEPSTPDWSEMKSRNSSVA